jgi:CMP-N,N'-diacetyllegionaminic acid synthase
MMTEGALTVVITARGGSSGIPGKNLRKVGPHSLVAWAILYSRFQGIRPVVSTDSPEIAAEAASYGALVPRLRSPRLAGPNARSPETVLDALEWLCPIGTYDEDHAVVLLEPTSPFRPDDVLLKAVRRLGNPETSAVVTVALALNEHPLNILYANDGLVDASRTSAQLGLPRQYLDACFYPEGTLYVSRVAALSERLSFYHESTALIQTDSLSKIDIDVEQDLAIANVIWNGMSAGAGADLIKTFPTLQSYAWMLEASNVSPVA